MVRSSLQPKAARRPQTAVVGGPVRRERRDRAHVFRQGQQPAAVQNRAAAGARPLQPVQLDRAHAYRVTSLT